MINNSKMDKITQEFLLKLNEMCKNDRRDFLIRERRVNYEHGSEIRKYTVTYRIKKAKNIWIIEAVSSGFWIFKKRFPLLRITKKNTMVNFSGLFTSTISDFKIDQLEDKLHTYLEICKNQPRDVFIKL